MTVHDEHPLAFDEWLSTVRTVCGPMDAERTGEDGFKGYVTSRRVADVRMLRHHADVASLHWNDRHIQPVALSLCDTPGVAGTAGGATERRGGPPAKRRLDPDRFPQAGGIRICRQARHRGLQLVARVVGKARLEHGPPIAPGLFRRARLLGVVQCLCAALYAQAETLNPDDTRPRETFLDLLFAACRRNSTRNRGRAIAGCSGR